MENLAHLTQLIEHSYAKTAPVLIPIHLFAHADRGIYRVDLAGEPPWLLRAYRQDPVQAAWLVERAATLVYVASADYPAPRVIPTADGAFMYYSFRPLSAEEVEALPIAVCFNDAVWAAQSIPQVIGKDWHQHRTLHRFGARYPVLAQIGEIAQQKIALLQ